MQHFMPLALSGTPAPATAGLLISFSLKRALESPTWLGTLCASELFPQGLQTWNLESSNQCSDCEFKGYEPFS